MSSSQALETPRDQKALEDARDGLFAEHAALLMLNTQQRAWIGRRDGDLRLSRGAPFLAPAPAHRSFSRTGSDLDAVFSDDELAHTLTAL